MKLILLSDQFLAFENNQNIYIHRGIYQLKGNKRCYVDNTYILQGETDAYSVV